MKHLPPYWAIKIDKEHPLWERFEKTISEESITSDNTKGMMNNGTQDWCYVGKDNIKGMYNGYNMAHTLENFNHPKKIQLITLEQFFGETQYEIY